MISKKQAVPCFALKFFLPFDHDALELFEIIFLSCPLSVITASIIHMLKLKYHIQFFSGFSRIFLCLFDSNSWSFTNCHDIISGKYFSVHFLKKFMNPRTMYAIWSKITIEAVIHFSIRESLVFGDHTDNIHTETVDSFFTPECHHIINFLAYFLVFPVEIRLFLWEQMQVIHLGLRIIFPCRTAKCTAPVVWFFSIDRIFPDIIITVRIVFGLAALNEPVVFIRSVVDYEIHQDLDATFMCLGKQFFVILHCSVVFINLLIIWNIVTIVILWRLKHRRNPQHIYAKFFQIIKFLYDSSDISNAISIAVIKTFRIYLIYDAFFPPFFLHAIWASCFLWFYSPIF